MTFHGEAWRQLICRRRISNFWRHSGFTQGDEMSELERIADQLRRTLEGEAWHGPAVLELLAGITPEQASARPILGVRSIWQLVLHLGGAYRVVLRRLR